MEETTYLHPHRLGYVMGLMEQESSAAAQAWYIGCMEKGNFPKKGEAGGRLRSGLRIEPNPPGFFSFFFFCFCVCVSQATLSATRTSTSLARAAFPLTLAATPLRCLGRSCST